ncbi:Uncharacterized alpha/beta hydrolase domain [Desulfomicrobium norvegicum]|uniref:Uncharacterized alpha/beta hydrolase domain n=1 Tax=Desulfomicrobium norvegicum (strain DSM 1741 / NCIMB 8310) TaxID=52561 RepID=A0A8G2C2P0_DESNO|nr:DUF2235 domain-containing protein [Desulfomicrobium norvegicum]SFL69550.1 Uncharacterized alpha/beta hydrolase domain [Desulfomicrobium norvegicum]
MKRIVIASDGTWNSPENEVPTNVLRVARAISPQSTDTMRQVVFYDWGVGSDQKKLSGGISGVGIDKNIMDCYRFIVQNYDVGDELYLFGFSRGAYTVRSLAGMIRNCGVLRREFERHIPKAFELYRDRGKKSAPDETSAKELRAEYCVADQTPIEFVGAWDTVGALGIPITFWGLMNHKSAYLFHDTSPSRTVKCARHALAIDETREDFTPVLWDEDKLGIDLKQVWFAGVHSDVGGGYADNHQLADIACNWLLQEAEARGLVIEEHATATLQPSPIGKQHDEFKGMYKLRGKTFREIHKESLIHRSVKDRFEKMGSSYRSPALRKFLELHSNDWSTVNIVS